MQYKLTFKQNPTDVTFTVPQAYYGLIMADLTRGAVFIRIPKGFEKRAANGAYSDSNCNYINLMRVNHIEIEAIPGGEEAPKKLILSS